MLGTRSGKPGHRSRIVRRIPIDNWEICYGKSGATRNEGFERRDFFQVALCGLRWSGGTLDAQLLHTGFECGGLEAE